MATFRHEIGIGDARSENFELVNAWVDTGALYSQVPASMLERLGHRPNATRVFKLADGSTDTLPVGSIPMRLLGEVQPTLFVFAEEDSDPLLGALALEEFGYKADPVNQILEPTIAMRLTRLDPEGRQQ